MATEPNTGLTLSPAGPLQADLVVNPIMRRLGAVGGNTRGVIDKDLTAPPGSPAVGDVYIIAASATGLWAGHDQQVAYWNGINWDFTVPSEGYTLYVIDEDVRYTFNGTTWDNSAGTGVTSVNDHTGVVTVLVPIVIACSDETTSLTTGAGKVTFRLPTKMTLLAGSSGVRASLTTAQSSGSILTVDINQNGSSILSTKLTVDNGEKTSLTAAAPPVISDTTLDDDAEITIDIDQIGDGTAKGLKVALIGYAPP